MRDFLKGKLKSHHVSEALFKEGLDGQMLLTWTKKEYKELDEEPKLKTAEIVMVMKVKDEFLQGKSENTTKSSLMASSIVQVLFDRFYILLKNFPIPENILLANTVEKTVCIIFHVY